MNDSQNKITLPKLIAELCPDGVEFKTLGDVCEVLRGKRLTKSQLSDDGKYPVLHGGSSPMGFYKEFNRKANTTVVVNTGNAGSVFFYDKEFWSSDACFALYPQKCLLDKFLYHFVLMREPMLKGKIRAGAMPTIDSVVVENLEIPVPPMEIQREIVRILDKFTELSALLETELAARKKQYEYYREKLLSGKKDFVTLDLISENCDSQRIPITAHNRESGEYPYYGASGIIDHVNDYIFDGDYLLVSEDGANLLARSTPIAFSISGKTWVNNHAHVLKFETYEMRRLVEFYLNSIDVSPWVTGGAQPKLNQKNLNKIPIPKFSESEQRRIVQILDRFDALCNDLSSGIPAEIAARKKQYEYYRDRLLTFREKIS